VLRGVGELREESQAGLERDVAVGGQGGGEVGDSDARRGEGPCVVPARAARGDGGFAGHVQGSGERRNRGVPSYG
jgi:hypothetical protein